MQTLLYEWLQQHAAGRSYYAYDRETISYIKRKENIISSDAWVLLFLKVESTTTSLCNDANPTDAT